MHREIVEDAGRPGRSAFADFLGKIATGKRVSRDDAADAISEILGSKIDPQVLQRDWVEQQQRQEQQQRDQARRVREWIEQQARWQSQQRQAPPPPRQPRIDPMEAAIRKARKVMGFDKELLAVDKNELKIRHRELAKKYHPDRPGGSTRKMQEVNAAVDILSKALETRQVV